MSSLEVSNIPIIGNLMQDIGFALDADQQQQVVAWGLKMAIIGDFLASEHRPYFFHENERRNFKETLFPPLLRTTAWLARYNSPDHLGLWGTDAWSEDRSIHVLVTTVLISHLLIQIVTVEHSPLSERERIQAGPRLGSAHWLKTLGQVWPPQRAVQWPPDTSIKDDGAFSLASVVRRFSYGKNLLPKP